MKIAYLFHWNEGPESGVFKKICSQAAAWSNMGHEVKLFIFTNNQNDDWDRHCGCIEADIARYHSWKSRFSRFRQLVERVQQWEPNMIYHRFDLYYPSMNRLFRKYPTVVEINSSDLTEMRMDSALRYWYHRVTRSKVLKACQGMVFVTGELSEEKIFNRFSKRHIVIGNGIELDRFPLPSETTHSEIRLVFIGSSDQCWHGIDKMAKLAHLQPEWQFDLIGVDNSEITGDIPPNMVFHGSLRREQYEPIMRQSDIAIGTLALHRKKMGEASTLKTREYLAYGIPVILGYKDTDFPDGSPFILKLPNRNDNIEPYVNEIEQFVRTWVGNRVQREEIGHLDTKQKEAIRLSFMEAVYEKHASL